MDPFLKDSLQILKLTIPDKTPAPEIGKLLRIAFAITNGSIVDAIDLGKNFGQLSEGSKRAFQQWLGSNQYHSVALAALMNDGGFQNEARNILEQTSKTLKRRGLLEIISSAIGGKEFISNNFSKLNATEQEYFLASWIADNTEKSDLLAIRAVSGNSRLIERLKVHFQSGPNTQIENRCNRLLEIALTKKEGCASLIVDICDSIYNSLHLFEKFSEGVNTAIGDALAHPQSSSLKILAFCIERNIDAFLDAPNSHAQILALFPALEAKINNAIFEREDAVNYIARALLSSSHLIFGRAIAELQTLDQDTRADILKQAILSPTPHKNYNAIASELSFIDMKMAFEFLVQAQLDRSNWANENNQAFLLSACITSAESRNAVRQAYKNAGLVATEWGLRKLSAIGICQIEKILESSDLGHENYAYVPSTIVGNPNKFKERGFKFGRLSQSHPKMIQVDLPENYAKDAIVGSQLVLCTDELVPIARIFPDPKQAYEALVIEPFPFSAQEVSIKDSAAAAMRIDWLTAEADSKNEGYANTLELVPGGVTKKLKNEERRETNETYEELSRKTFDLLQQLLTDIIMHQLMRRREHKFRQQHEIGHERSL